MPEKPSAAKVERDAYAAALAALPDGIIVLDRDGAARLVNSAAQRLLGAEDVAAGTRLDDLLADAELRALAKRALDGEAAEAVSERASAEALRVVAAPLGIKAGGALLLLHDETAARRLEQTRQAFVANASHELLTPVGTVMALVEALASGGIDKRKTAKRFLKQLRREAERLAVLARDLLDLAQIESGEFRLDLAPVDADALAGEVVDRMARRAKKAHLRLERQGAATPALARADAARLEQVLVNLVENAIKYTPSGGAVTLHVAAEPGLVVFRVTDTGVGIAAADLPRVFERFYKARTTPANSKRPGTGLGLAIARHLIEAMGGRLWVESAPGAGATFSVAVPRAQENSEG